MLDPFCPLPNVDFDTWSKLAKSDPEAFEEKRKKLVDHVISQAPEDRRERLRCLQWRIDMVRETANTPMAACLKISRMMWDSVLGPNGLLEMLQQIGQSPEVRLARGDERKDADILPFPMQSEEIKAGF